MTDRLIRELCIRTFSGAMLALVFFGSYFYIPYSFLIFMSFIASYVSSRELPKLITDKKNLLLVAFFYPAIPVGLLMMLEYHYRSFNELLPLAPFLLAAAVDTGGYVVGTLWGKHKIAPRISPGKSYEGLFGSFFAVLLFLTLGRSFFIQTPWSFLTDSSFLTKLLLSIFFTVLGFSGGQLISYLKRKQGLKDCGALIPGHGGILDRCDGLFFIVPGFWLVYLFLRLL